MIDPAYAGLSITRQCRLLSLSRSTYYFNTDQGSQSTGFEFINVLKGVDVKISMDGKGRWMDNVFIEQLWRSLKYECVYLNALETGSEAREGIGGWLTYYNSSRPHSSLGRHRTQDEAYGMQGEDRKLAA